MPLPVDRVELRYAGKTKLNAGRKKAESESERSQGAPPETDTGNFTQ